MFALLDKENNILFTSSEDIQDLPEETRTMEYDDKITNPIYFEWRIIQDMHPLERKLMMQAKIIKEGVNWITSKTDLEGVEFTEDEIETMKDKHMFPKGCCAVLKEVLFLQANGNFSAGQAVGSRLLNIENSFNSKKSLLLITINEEEDNDDELPSINTSDK